MTRKTIPLQLQAEHRACKPGARYAVRCVFVKREWREPWIPRDGWAPVIGPRHEDAEHLEFPWPHWHIDWRFVPAAQFHWATHGASVMGSPHGCVLVSATDYLRADDPPQLKWRTCRRLMPTFPSMRADGAAPDAAGRIRFARLEMAHAFTCARLKPGGICPHRGIDLNPFAQPDGTAVCPAHGLRWRLATGELLPHHAR